METLLKYRFLEHLYTSSKYTYVEILCECLNKSKNMTLLTGVSFELIKEQFEKQPDVKSQVSGYSLDEHRNLKDADPKAIIHFFGKVLMAKKNILLFLYH